MATTNGQSHLWRQRLPKGMPEQITYRRERTVPSKSSKDIQPRMARITRIASGTCIHVLLDAQKRRAIRVIRAIRGPTTYGALTGRWPMTFADYSSTELFGRIRERNFIPS